MTGEFGSWVLAWPWLLLALPLPWLAARLLPPARATLATALRVPFGTDLKALERDARRAPRTRWSLPLLIAWALLCIAAARPQQLGEARQLPQTGRDLLLAVDLSGSMATEDMRLGARTVDRLTAAKAVLGDFLDRRVGDRVGLLLFGERAYAVTPLTLDREAVRQQLNDSVVGLAGTETAIGDAIALTVKRLTQNADASQQTHQGERVLILLTDGVNTAGALTPEKATQLAAEAHVRVHTIGFGGEGIDTGFFGLRLPKRSEIDEAALQAIAEKTGGRYFRARDTSELVEIYAELDRIEPAPRPGEILQLRIERYPLPLMLALAIAAFSFGARHFNWRQLAHAGATR